MNAVLRALGSFHTGRHSQPASGKASAQSQDKARTVVVLGIEAAAGKPNFAPDMKKSILKTLLEVEAFEGLLRAEAGPAQARDELALLAPGDLDYVDVHNDGDPDLLVVEFH